MKKKILSLLLSLSMIMTIAANFTVVSAENEDFAMSVKYYSDPDNLEESEITSVEVGNIFYVGVSIQSDKRVKLIETSVGYDPSMVSLVDYANDANELVVPDDGIVGNDSSLQSNNFGEDLVNAESYGVRFFNVDNRVKIESNASRPKIEKKGQRYVSDVEVKNEPGVIISFSHGKGQSNGNISTEKNLVLLKFKAKNSGQGVFTFPHRIRNQDASFVEGDYYEESITTGVLIIDEDQNYANVGNNLSINSTPINIIRNIPILDAPSNVQLTGRKITWTPVTGENSNFIGDYKVKVVATDSNANDTYYIDGSETTDSYAMLPEEIIYGALEITVETVSNDPLNCSSSLPSTKATGSVSVDLSAPANIRWNESNSSEILWDAVPNAEKYKIELTKNGEPVTLVQDEVPVPGCDLSQYITEPNEGKNVYVVKVTAVNTNPYVNDDTVGATINKTLLGKLYVVQSAGWDSTTPTKAVWVDGQNSAASVSKYSITLYRDGNWVGEFGTNNANTKYYDFGSNMQAPGIYEYVVKALGATTSEGSYKDSDEQRSSEKIVSKQYDNVTNITWSEKVVTWEAAEGNNFTLQLYKDGIQIGSDIRVSDKTYDFSQQMGSKGTYTVKIKVNGDGTIYFDSEWAEKETTIEKDSHSPATGLAWDTTTLTKAVWDPDPAATNGYKVKLYFNGVEIKLEPSEYPYIDFANYMKYPGDYTFGVIKNETQNPELGQSTEVISTEVYRPSVVRTGNVYVELSKDPEGTIPATGVDVGDVFYAHISMEGTEDFNILGVPFKFDPEKVRVVDENGMPVADGEVELDDVGTEGVILGDMLENDDVVISQSSVDNTKGLVVLSAYADGSVVSTATKTKVMTVRMRAVAYSSSATDFTFAVANDDGNPYESTIKFGFSFTNNNVPLFANITDASISIDQGTLPKMAAPVWDGTNITWTKLGSSVTGYEIVLYKNGVQYKTYNVSYELDSYPLAADVTGVGSYTVAIRAKGDGNVGDCPDLSDQSEAYVVAGGGGGGGSSRPPKEPEKPEEPDQPDGPATPDQPEMDFIDIDGHWAEEQIKELSTYGILAGYGDGTFRPNLGITRAEFTTLMVSALGYENYEVEEEMVYDDTTNHWAKKAISIGTELGFVSGIGDNLFAPDVIITREQVAAIIHRIAGNVEAAEISQYADRENVTKYAKPAVDYVSEKNIMIGFEDNTFRGKEQTTRAQMVIVLLKLLNGGFFNEYYKN